MTDRMPVKDCPAHRVGFKHAHLDRIEPDPGGELA